MNSILGKAKMTAIATAFFLSASLANATEHNISAEYGILTLTDFAAALGSAIADIGSKDDNSSNLILGAISINYGYEISDLLETGLILNFAMPLDNKFLLTFMPRLKLNLNSGEFVNPYMELDGGATTDFDEACSMIHFTFLGLEIGPVYFQILGFGQRGLFYVGFKHSF